VSSAPAPAAPPRPAPPPRQDRPKPAPRPPQEKKQESQRIDTAQQKKIEQDTRTGTRAVQEPVPMWIFVAKKAEIEQGKAIVSDLGGPKVAVFNVDGVYHVISNECGHQGGPLGEGKLEGFSVVCPWHQWKFDVTTGNCLSVGGSSVRKYEVAAAGDDLYVRV